MKENTGLVSIIVPIYGVEKYIRQCIESICSQTYENIEIILVDDGSKDHCPEICDEYAKRDSRIVVIHKENGGLVSARKAGVKKAVGKYVQFVDGDDWVKEDLIESMVRMMEKYQTDCVKCTYYCAGDTITETSFVLDKGYYDKEKLKRELYGRMLFSGHYFSFGVEPQVWTAFFRRDILLNVMGPEPEAITLGEDAAILYRYLLRCSSIYLLDEPHYYYRLNPASMCHAYSGRQTLSTISLILYLKDTLGKYTEFHLPEQLNYYHLAIATNNLNNESMMGFTGGFRKRLQNLKCFAKRTQLKKAYKDTDKSLLKEKPLNRMLLWCYVHGLTAPCLAGLSIFHQLNNNKTA